MPKRRTLTYLEFSLAVLFAFAAISPAHADDLKTFTGEIADSSCALNIHSLTRSHREMLKSNTMGKSAASCSRYCVDNLSASYVLVSKNDVYRLDQQDQAKNLAGRKLKLTGTLDPKTNTIHVHEWLTDSNPSAKAVDKKNGTP